MDHTSFTCSSSHVQSSFPICGSLVSLLAGPSLPQGTMNLYKVYEQGNQGLGMRSTNLAIETNPFGTRPRPELRKNPPSYRVKLHHFLQHSKLLYWMKEWLAYQQIILYSGIDMSRQICLSPRQIAFVATQYFNYSRLESKNIPGLTEHDTIPLSPYLLASSLANVILPCGN